MSFKPSIHQQRIYDFVRTGSGSAKIEAVAGSGKTTTIVEAVKFIPRSDTVTFLAFNKKIADELKSRLPEHVRAATFHSQGLGAWRYAVKSVGAPLANKTVQLANRHLSAEEFSRVGSCAIALVGKAKGAGIGAIVEDTVAAWKDLSDRFDIYPERAGASIEEAIQAARRLLSASIDVAKTRPSCIDFDDMLFMPLVENVSFFQTDWLIVDESQDTNAVQLALLRRMLRPGGRLIAVGDTRQAIYGFRGADSEAMTNLGTAFNCQTFPLSISYRCSRSVVRLAQTVVPHIEASATAPEGEVVLDVRTSETGGFTTGNPEKATDERPFLPTDAILCRNTAPLVSLAYRLISKGVGCRVLGREIGAGLVVLIKSMKAKNVDKLTEKLNVYADREISKLLSKGQETKAEAVRDRVDCIATVIESLDENHRTIPAVCDSIQNLFVDTGTGMLTLCTVHKSKGLEWDRVFIYLAKLMPSKWARQAWQQEQESNLRYVAYTRAKKSLYFLNS